MAVLTQTVTTETAINWEELAQKIKDNTSGLKVGDIITEKTLDGEEMDLVVVDMGPDWARFESKDCLPVEVAYNQNNRNAGGFADSDVKRYPDVVAQIENAAREAAASEAVTAERSRLQEIETIEATVGDPELVKEAKYGPTACSAQELAFKAMKKQAQLGAQHIQNSADDFTASGAAGVGTTPNSGAPAPKDQAADENAQVAQLAAMIANGGAVPAPTTPTK